VPPSADQHKAYHAAISKFGKAVDRAFDSGPADMCRDVDLDRRIVDEMVALYLYREVRSPMAVGRVDSHMLITPA
jgi:hypothetical protein